MHSWVSLLSTKLFIQYWHSPFSQRAQGSCAHESTSSQTELLLSAYPAMHWVQVFWLMQLMHVSWQQLFPYGHTSQRNGSEGQDTQLGTEQFPSRDCLSSKAQLSRNQRTLFKDITFYIPVIIFLLHSSHWNLFYYYHMIFLSKR